MVFSVKKCKKKEFVFDYDAIMTSSSPYALTPGDQPLVEPVVSKEFKPIHKIIAVLSIDAQLVSIKMSTLHPIFSY